MNTDTIRLLNQLNNNFYNTTAADFDDSRQYFWKGWSKTSPYLDAFESARVADIGCGNGRFGQFILENHPDIKLSYTGVDSNQQLLAFAEENLEGKIPALHLQKIDIMEALITNEDFLKDQTFQFIGSFGVFHHIPSYKLRLQLLKVLLSKLDADGYLVISLWQFIEFERFQKKVLKNEATAKRHGFSLKDLEKNDYILDWQRGAQALRYCHYYSEDEQMKLFSEANAQLVESFRADGKEGNVNQYVVLQQK
jgi:SAM-dependent methyltransferase